MGRDEGKGWRVRGEDGRTGEEFTRRIYGVPATVVIGDNMYQCSRHILSPVQSIECSDTPGIYFRRRQYVPMGDNMSCKSQAYIVAGDYTCRERRHILQCCHFILFLKYYTFFKEKLLFILFPYFFQG